MILTPDAYKPFPTLVLCSNVLSNVRVPVAMDDVSVLLIGSGHTFPLVWLATRRSPEDPKWYSVVDESRSTHPNVSVVVDTPARGVTVAVQNQHLVLRARAVAPDEAIVDSLDLRPFGLELFGDATGLQVGKSRFSGNQFRGMDVGFAFGGPNSDLRQKLSVAKRAAGDNRNSVYLQDVLREATARVEYLRGVLKEMERLAALPTGHPERLKVVAPEREVINAKAALADALDVQFQIENWIAGK